MTWLKRSTSRERSGEFEIPAIPDGVLQVCHADWRGVRTSAYAFRDPVIESSDLKRLSTHAEDLIDAGVSTVVIQGWPPNAPQFALAMASLDVRVLTVFHSSPAQHGVDPGEAEAVRDMLILHKDGIVDRIATVKAGVADAFSALGHDIVHVGNRIPIVEPVEPATVAEGTNVGIFLYPMWRKNVTTQILAAHKLGWRPFVMDKPDVGYISRNDLTICGELPRNEFLPIQAAMDITLNVTLSECHPMQPMESYLLGVPCLMSRTSDLFADDPELWDLTTVDQADNPDAIATGAERLLGHTDEAVERATAALRRMDAVSKAQWLSFTRP